MVLDVLGEDCLEVTAAEDEHPVEAIGPDGADDALADGVGTRCSDGGGGDTGAVGGELGVAVADAELDRVRLVGEFHRDVTGLLGDPAGDRVGRDAGDPHAQGRTDGMGVMVGQLLDRWLEECERLGLSPPTVRNYRSQVNGTIRPRLGKLKLHQLTPKHLDDLYGTLKDAGKSPKTVRNVHAILSAALHQAVRWGWLRENIAERAKPPRVSNRRVTAPAVDVVQQVIEEAERRDPRLAPLLMLAALTGMRRGELCALRWSDVNLDVGVLDVARSLVVAPGGLAEKSTKTDRSRKVALDPVGIALLTAHRKRVEDWIAEAGGALADDAFVFSPYVEGVTPFRPDNVTSFFIRVRDAVGAPDVRLHDLRHSTATQLIHAGMDIRTVADFLSDETDCELPELAGAETVGPVIEERPPRRLTMTVEEAAVVLGISRATAYDAVSRGEIPCIRIGRRILIPKVALARMLDGGGPGVGSPRLIELTCLTTCALAC